jgi:hypothetical protein
MAQQDFGLTTCHHCGRLYHICFSISVASYDQEPPLPILTVCAKCFDKWARDLLDDQGSLAEDLLNTGQDADDNSEPSGGGN